MRSAVFTISFLLLFTGCASRPEKTAQSGIAALDFKVFALETIISEKQKIDDVRGSKRDELYTVESLEESFQAMWLEYFTKFHDPEKQWIYGLKPGQESALIDYIKQQRKRLELKDIKE